MNLLAAAAPPPAALHAAVAEFGAQPCALYGRGDALIWMNAEARRLAQTAGDAAFGQPGERAATLATGRPARRRLELPAQGERRWVALRLQRVEAGDGPAVLCVANDVTTEMRALQALREARERADDLTALVSDCVWETDADWRLRHFSARRAEGERGSLVGRSLFDVGVFESTPPAAGARAPRPPSPRLRAIFRGQRFRMAAGDRTRVYALSGMPRFDAVSGDFLGYRGSGEDVTERLLAEREADAARGRMEQTLAQLEARNALLDRALAAVEAADTAKSQFLARMSHELRTPLNAILGLASVLRFRSADALDDQSLGFIDEIRRSGEHLLALVEDVLQFARNDVAELRLAREPVDLGALAAEAAAFLRVAAAERDVRLSVEAGPGLVVMGDRTRLRQVFINLFGNAVKFSRGGGAVRGAVRREGRRVIAEVADEGEGIPADQLEAVFLPFHQVDGTTTRNQGGVGLGLALCRQIVEAHGGAITLASTVGVGTTATVALDAA